MQAPYRLTLALLAVLWVQSAPAAPIPTRPVHTNKTRFRIPYRFDGEEIRRLAAREIRLYVSTDYGSRWFVAQSVAPVAGRFEFQAPRDGEYWFAVRTLDGRGRLHPEGQITEPGLRVVVDTTLPELTITVRQLEAGKAQAEWKGVDLHLEPSQLRMEYILAGAAKWRPLRVPAQAAGQVVWTIPAGGLVAVRGSIQDQAGNVGRAQHQLGVAPADQIVPRPSVPDFSQPIAALDSVPGSSLTLPQDFSTTSTDTTEFGAHEGIGPEPERSLAELRSALSDMTQAPSAPNPRNRLIRSSDNSRPEITRGRYRPQERDAGQQRAELHDRAGQSRGWENVQVSRIVNSRRFMIDYRIDGVGPSGVRRVELYVTRDDGRTWTKHGEDTDRVSPILVEVAEDGMYGFSLRVQSGNATVSRAPIDGEQPDFTLRVDQTPPSVSLLPAQTALIGGNGDIVFQWIADDQNPVEGSVSLAYATEANGPWEVFADRIPNTGRYRWQTPTNIPPQLYIRLTVEDAAGNSAHATTDQPIFTDRARPTARILNVETAAKPSPAPQ